MSNTMDVTRKFTLNLEVPGGIQSLVDELNAVIARNSVDPEDVVKRINGGDQHFELIVVKATPEA